jgi:predicted ATP-grasp superfamily ATP-dependent carboligase/uncharacterized protein Usg
LNTNILLTGGRAPVTLELARQFAAVGHRVFVADSLHHHLCSYSRSVFKNFLVPSPRFNATGFIQALVDIIEAEKIDLLIPTCEEIFYIASGIDRLTPLCKVFAEPLDKLDLLHNKWEFICQVNKLGLPAPKTWLIQSDRELQDILTIPTPTKIVLKPVYSRFASNVHILDKPVVTIPPLEINAQRTWVAQEFIAGTHYCTYSIAHQGKLTAHAVYPTSYTADAGSCIYFESIDHPQLLNWVETFVLDRQFTGQIAFDFIQAEDGTLYPLECNPRAISAIHLFRVEDRLDRAFLDLTDRLIQPQPLKNAMLMMAMIIYGLPSAISAQRLGDWLTKIVQGKDVIWQLTDPLPFFHLWIVLLQFWQMSRDGNLTLQQASTRDIEWDGEEIDK